MILPDVQDPDADDDDEQKDYGGCDEEKFPGVDIDGGLHATADKLEDRKGFDFEFENR